MDRHPHILNAATSLLGICLVSFIPGLAALFASVLVATVFI